MAPKIAIIVAKFNYSITSALLDAAKSTLLTHGVPEKNILIQWVPGAFELPFAAQKIARTHTPDAVICLGVVIQGGTPHFDYVCQQTAAGIMQVGLTENLPVIFGVLTTKTIDQALERSGLSPVTTESHSKRHLQVTADPSTNKGEDAALAALEMLSF